MYKTAIRIFDYILNKHMENQNKNERATLDVRLIEIDDRIGGVLQVNATVPWSPGIKDILISDFILDARLDFVVHYGNKLDKDNYVYKVCFNDMSYLPDLLLEVEDEPFLNSSAYYMSFEFEVDAKTLHNIAPKLELYVSQAAARHPNIEITYTGDGNFRSGAEIMQFTDVISEAIGSVIEHSVSHTYTIEMHNLLEVETTADAVEQLKELAIETILATDLQT